MPQCKRCGKKGLFLQVDSKGLCSACAKKQAVQIIKIQSYYSQLSQVAEDQKQLAHSNTLLDSVLTAKAEYKQDHDVNKCIAAYEYALIKAKPPLVSQSHSFFLIDLYIKADKLSDAWSYMNFLAIYYPDATDKIRFQQSRILKKENKYQDALETLAAGYLLKSKWNNTFQWDMFKKDASSIVKKIGWSDDESEAVAALVARQVHNRNYDEALFIYLFRQLLRSFPPAGKTKKPT